MVYIEEISMTEEQTGELTAASRWNDLHRLNNKTCLNKEEIKPQEQEVRAFKKLSKPNKDEKNKKQRREQITRKQQEPEGQRNKTSRRTTARAKRNKNMHSEQYQQPRERGQLGRCELGELESRDES